MIPRLHCPDATLEWAGALTPEQARKLFRVLRMRAGDAVILFDGKGGEYAAAVESLRPESASARVVESRPNPAADLGMRARVGQALCAPNKMDWAVEKMTELGALEIIPLRTAKSVPVKLDLQRMRRLAIAACEQCGRARVPEIRDAEGLTEFLARPFAGAGKVALSPRAEKSLSEVLTGVETDEELIFLCGPESGFSAEEEEMIRGSGFIAAKLGGRILRAETAALAALAAAEALR